ncbi:sensor histidine kinase [Paenibacillus sepulcri]|uniref:histidine kinase n=1 Tax=Paenibacillus sepulcri TaxID=359917 RepID=A0ABS7BYR9_9BACL|nr:sensor histidine kinase [Paenibacillus sepulcri]
MDYRSYGKPFASAAVIFFLMNTNRMFEAPLPQIGIHLVIWATFSGILFIPKTWWTITRAVIAASLLIIECAIGIIWFQEMKLLYFIAILLFAAALRQSLLKGRNTAIAVMFITATLYIRFGHADLFNLVSFILLAIVLYFFIRSRIQRNEIHEMNKRHLEELQDAYEQLQDASATALQNAILEERTHIAREIHDAVGHSLTSLIVQMQALRYMMKEDPVQAGQSLEGMLGVARQGLQDIRSSVHALAGNRTIPGIAALKSLLSRMEAAASIAYRFHTDLQDEDVSAEVYETLFPVLQESITNVMRHSRATLLEVGLGRDGDNIVMRIRDNGVLADDYKISEGFGLRVMKARLEEKGGSLSYRIAEQDGFEITATIPSVDTGGQIES